MPVNLELAIFEIMWQNLLHQSVFLLHISIKASGVRVSRDLLCSCVFWVENIWPGCDPRIQSIFWSVVKQVMGNINIHMYTQITGNRHEYTYELKFKRIKGLFLIIFLNNLYSVSY